MKSALPLAVCLALSALSAWALSCDLSWGGGCNVREAARLKCLHGVATDPCRRCICAKGPGMACGGPWNLTGKCGLGLVCDKDWYDLNSDGTCVSPVDVTTMLPTPGNVKMVRGVTDESDGDQWQLW